MSYNLVDPTTGDLTQVAGSIDTSIIPSDASASNKLATMDKLVPSTRLKGGFKVVAYSDRTITGNSKLECLENWVTNALSQYGDNLVIIGNLFNTPYMDGFAIVNVWGSKKDGILGASGIVIDQEGMYYYKTINGVPGSGTLTKIN